MVNFLSNLKTTSLIIPDSEQLTSLIWLDLLNWIPLFLLFFSAQIYLKKDKQRSIFSKVLIAGTIPVLISCALQSWFRIYGPFELFNGLIIWFQKELPATDYGVSGLYCFA